MTHRAAYLSDVKYFDEWQSDGFMAETITMTTGRSQCAHRSQAAIASAWIKRDFDPVAARFGEHAMDLGALAGRFRGEFDHHIGPGGDFREHCPQIRFTRDLEGKMMEADIVAAIKPDGGGRAAYLPEGDHGDAIADERGRVGVTLADQLEVKAVGEKSAGGGEIPDREADMIDAPCQWRRCRCFAAHISAFLADAAIGVI